MFDGMELSYKNSIDNYNYNVVFTPYGQTSKYINISEDMKRELILENAIALKFNIEKGPFTFQSSYTHADLDLPTEDKALVQLRDELKSLGNDVIKYFFPNKKFLVWTIGIKYDEENFIFNSEYARLKTF